MAKNYNANHETMVRTNVFLTHEQRNDLQFLADTMAEGRPFNTMAAQARIAVEEYTAEVLQGAAVRAELSLDDYQFLVSLLPEGLQPQDELNAVRSLCSEALKFYLSELRARDV